MEPCNEMMDKLEKTITDSSFTGKEFSFGGKTYKVKVADNFSYTDPVDKSVSTKQVQFQTLFELFLLLQNDFRNRDFVLCSKMVAEL